MKNDWIVYAKRPFGGPQQVLRYLARYTHRVAISNRRLLDLKDGQVRLQYKDYADEQRSKTMTLSSSEFIRRFLMHTLPSRFVRIRYFGILANRFRKQRLDQSRTLLGISPQALVPAHQLPASTTGGDEQEATSTCLVCRGRRLLILELPTSLTLRPPHFLRSPRHALPEIPAPGRSPPH